MGGRRRPVTPVNGEWLQQKMAEKGLAQVDVARELGLHLSAVSRILSGARSLSVSDCAKLAFILGEYPQSVMLAAGLELRDMEAATYGLKESAVSGGVKILGSVAADWSVTWKRPLHGPVSAPLVLGAGDSKGMVALQCDTGPGMALDGALLYLDDPRPRAAPQSRRASVMRGATAAALAASVGKPSVVHYREEGGRKTEGEWVWAFGILFKGDWAGRYTIQPFTRGEPVASNVIVAIAQRVLVMRM